MESSFQTAVVIYLDVLGTKDRQLFQDKLKIHQLFHKEVISNENRQLALPNVIYNRSVKSFSDCAIFIYTYKSEIEAVRKNDCNLLYISLYNTSISILSILRSGFLIRGGACIGDTFIDDLGFFGPAVEEAYHLESEVACYPRIVLPRNIGRNISEWEASQEIDETASTFYSRIPRLVLLDHDGMYYLNIFYALEQSGKIHIGSDLLELDAIKAIIFNMLSNEEISNQGNEHKLRKIYWMNQFTLNAQSALKPDLMSRPISIVINPEPTQ